jgi:hypothetical protein
MISTKPVPLNVPFSIRDNFEADSNVTEESDSQLRKHPPLKTSIDPGMKNKFQVAVHKRQQFNS